MGERRLKDVRKTHACYFRDLAETAEPHLTAPDQVQWLDLIEMEYDNCRLALSWAVEQGEAEIGLRTRAAIWRFWIVRGFLAEGRRQLEHLRAMSRPADHSQAWIKVSSRPARWNAPGCASGRLYVWPIARSP